jgi:hypothetical protein
MSSPARSAGTILTVGFVLRSVLSLLSDLNDAPQGLERLAGWLRLPGPEIFNSGWFSMAVATVGLLLLWHGRVRQPLASPPSLYRPLKDAFYKGRQLLAAVHASRRGSPQERETQYYMMLSTRLAQDLSAWEVLEAERSGEQLKLLHAHRNSYKTFCALDFNVADYVASHPANPNVTEYIESKRALVTQFDVACGYREHEQLETEALRERPVFN